MQITWGRTCRGLDKPTFPARANVGFVELTAHPQRGVAALNMLPSTAARWQVLAHIPFIGIPCDAIGNLTVDSVNVARISPHDGDLKKWKRH